MVTFEADRLDFSQSWESRYCIYIFCAFGYNMCYEQVLCICQYGAVSRFNQLSVSSSPPKNDFVFSNTSA